MSTENYNEERQAFPLDWPADQKRTRYRKPSRFKTGRFGVVRDALIGEIRKLGGRDAILSTNIPIKRDGLPYAQYREPNDPGVAVFFSWKGRQYCMACDKFSKVEENVIAVQKTIESIRGIERWGAGEMMERAFSGFAALPDPSTVSVRSWWEILGISENATSAEIRSAYLERMKTAHPDVGGSDERAMEVNNAFQQGMAQIK